MNITRIEIWNFSPTFRDGPYAMSHVTQDAAYGRILRVETSEEITGSGEIVFAPSLSAEERKQMILQEPNFLHPLIGHDIAALDHLAQAFRELSKAGRGVAFGIETAFLDIKAQRQNQSLSDLLGGAQNDSVDDYFSISERSIESIQQRLKEAGPDRKVIQLKLGIGSLDEDLAQITATLDAMNENQLLLADANGGWDVARACEIINQFDDPRVVWEEPCTSYDENAEVAQKVTQPVMLDQCVGNAALAKRAIAEGFADSICIKPAFLGGLTPAREIRDLCVSKKVKMRIDGPWCGDIATAANLHLAVGAPPELLVAGCDLREPLVVEPCLDGVKTTGSARIGPPGGLGLGVEASVAMLGDPEAVYR